MFYEYITTAERKCKQKIARSLTLIAFMPAYERRANKSDIRNHIVDTNDSTL